MKKISFMVILAFTLASYSAGAATITLPQTGQRACYDAAGAVITCAGTGQDGEFQAGAGAPTQRFTDNGNGTVTDNMTGLIWLKNAGCYYGSTSKTWASALAVAAVMANGTCGLTDGSKAGDWRIPNINELESLIDAGVADIALSAGHPFTNVKQDGYWSSTTTSFNADGAMYVSLRDGNTNYMGKGNYLDVLTVRGGL